MGTSKQHPYETDIHVPFYVRGPGIKGGSVRPEMVSNVDLLPTMLELAGAEIPAFADGRSLVSLLHGDNVAAPAASPAWRQHLLIEYLSVGTYFNDHSSIWQDGDETSRRCNCSGPPVGPDPATKGSMCKEANETGMGNCYFLDSVHSNNWRLLRIMNETDNLAYIEYDPAWKFEPNTQFQWCVGGIRGDGGQLGVRERGASTAILHIFFLTRFPPSLPSSSKGTSSTTSTRTRTSWPTFIRRPSRKSAQPWRLWHTKHGSAVAPAALRPGSPG